MLKLGLFFVSRISLAHKTDFYKRAYAFLPMYLLGPPPPLGSSKKPALGRVLWGLSYDVQLFY